MLKPITGCEFCTMGAGYKIHVRTIGSRKAKCGSSAGRTGTNRVTIKDANRCIEQGSWTVCAACALATITNELITN